MAPHVIQTEEFHKKYSDETVLALNKDQIFRDVVIFAEATVRGTLLWQAEEQRAVFAAAAPVIYCSCNRADQLASCVKGMTSQRPVRSGATAALFPSFSNF